MSINVVLVRVLVEGVELVGCSGAALLAAAEFDPQRLQDSTTRVTEEEYERIQLAALELTGDAALGLRIGLHASYVGFDVLANLVAHAPTLRDGVNSASRFYPILADSQSETLLESGDLAIIRNDFYRGDPRAQRFTAELLVIGSLRMVRHFAGPGARLRRACFEYARPDYAAEYTQIFEGIEQFEQPFTGVELDRALLDRASLHGDPELYPVLELQATRKLDRLLGDASFAGQLLTYLSARPPAERTEPEAAAQHFGMTVRSLRERLKAEGVTYTQLSERALAAIAQRLLRDPDQSISAVAYAMGFSDPSAFHRAFKRWTGTTPKQYRNEP